MAHITLLERLPGYLGLMAAYPEIAKHLNGLAEALLRKSSSLTSAECEMIATFVSLRNECIFCMNAHAAVARHLLEKESKVIDEIIQDYQTASITEKMKALLTIADKVRQDGRMVTKEDIAKARTSGADDKAIHDTVLIAAAFCMYNRYVDGLATRTPKDPIEYERIGANLAEKGYTHSALTHKRKI